MLVGTSTRVSVNTTLLTDEFLKLPFELISIIITFAAEALPQISQVNHQLRTLSFDYRRKRIESVWNIETEGILSKELLINIFKKIMMSMSSADSLHSLQASVDQLKIAVLELNGPLNLRYLRNNTPFSCLCHYAATTQHPDFYETYLDSIKWALERGADSNLREISHPPLFSLLANQPSGEQQQKYFTTIVEMLLQFGARPDLTFSAYNFRGNALHFAEINRRPLLLKLLERHTKQGESTSTLCQRVIQAVNSLLSSA